MAGNFDGIRQRNFGIEIEMTGLTRCQAAKAIAKVLGGSPNHVGGSYDKYTVEDSAGRTWSIVYDSSIISVDSKGNPASDSYKVELNSPVLGYEDIPLLQEVIRALRHEKGRCSPEYEKYKELAEKQIVFLSVQAAEYPAGHSLFLLAKLLYENPPEHVTIVMDDKSDLSEIRTKLPFWTNISVVSESEKYLLLNNKTTYYVCRGHMCLPPVNEYICG